MPEVPWEQVPMNTKTTAGLYAAEHLGHLQGMKGDDRPGVWQSAMQLVNPIVAGSVHQYFKSQVDGEHDPFYEADIRGYEDYAWHVYGARNHSEEIAIKSQIDMERQAQSRLDSAGWLGVAATIGAGAVDPSNFIPAPVPGKTRVVLHALRQASRTKAFLVGAGRAASGVAIGQAATEPFLTNSLYSRTTEDAIFDTVAGMMLFGMIGGAHFGIRQRILSAELRKGESPYKGMTQAEADAMQRKWDNTGKTELDDDEIMSATRAMLKDPENASALQGGLLTAVLRRLPGVPIWRAASSVRSAIRNAGQILADTPFLRQGRARGASIQAFADLMEIRSGEVIDGLQSSYKALRDSKAGDPFAGGFRSQKLSGLEPGHDFVTEVWRVAQGAEPSVGGTAKQFVREGAQVVRRFIDDQIARVSKESGLLSQLDEIAQYMSRLHDTNAARLFKDEWIRDHANAIEQFYETRGQVLPSTLATPSQRLEAAGQYWRKVVDWDEGRRVHTGEASIARFFRDRTFPIDNLDVEKWLVRDPEVIARSLARKVGAQAALAKRAPRFGTEILNLPKKFLDRVQRFIAGDVDGINTFHYYNQDLRAAHLVFRTLTAGDGSRVRLSEAEAAARKIADMANERFALAEKVDAGNLSLRPRLEELDQKLLRIRFNMKKAADENGVKLPLQVDREPIAKADNFAGAIDELADQVSGTQKSEAMTGVSLEHFYRDATREAEAEMAAELSPRKKKRIQRNLRRDIDAVETMRQAIEGTENARPPDDSIAFRVSRTAKDVNTLRAMGTGALAQFNELVMPAFTQGFGPWLRGLQERFGQILSNVKPRRANLEKLIEIFEINTGTHTRRMHLQDDGIHVSAKRSMVQRFYSITGFNHITGFNKGNGIIAANDSALRLSERIATGKRLTKSELNNLKLAGIDEDMARRIHKEWVDAGRPQGDHVYMPRTDLWNDRSLADAFEASIVQEVNRTVLKPGVGEIPRIGRPSPEGRLISNEILSVLLQFKSFPISATSKIFISGMQRADARVFAGLIPLMAAGAFVEVANRTLKQGRGERSPELMPEAGEFVFNAIDRSGVLGIAMELNNIMHSTLQAGPVNWALGAGTNATRYDSRNFLDALAGPSLGLVEDIGTLVYSGTQALRGQTPTDTDLAALRRILPYQNFWATRYFADVFQRKIADELPDRRARRE